MQSAKPLIDEIRSFHLELGEFVFEKEIKKLVYGKAADFDEKSLKILKIELKRLKEKSTMVRTTTIKVEPSTTIKYEPVMPSFGIDTKDWISAGILASSNINVSARHDTFTHIHIFAPNRMTTSNPDIHSIAGIVASVSTNFSAAIPASPGAADSPDVPALHPTVHVSLKRMAVLDKIARKLKEKDNVSSESTENDVFTCKICSQKFSRQWNLNRHEDSVHKNISPFQCQKCPKKYKTKYYLDAHMKNIHNVKNKKNQK